MQQEDNVGCWVEHWNSSADPTGRVTDGVPGEVREQKVARVLELPEETGFPDVAVLDISGGMLYPFMYPSARGSRPLIRSDHTVRDTEQDWTGAAERTISEEEKAEIRDASPNGRYRSVSDMYTDMTVWMVSGR